jgi:hypothetical protein
MTLPSINEYPDASKKRFDAITDEQIAKALWAAKGLQAHAALRLDCAPSLISMRVKQSPYLQQVREDAREVRKDNCEKALDTIIESLETSAVIFSLKTLCKDRGYAQDTVLVDATDPVKVLMAEIRNQSKDLVDETRQRS